VPPYLADVAAVVVLLRGYLITGCLSSLPALLVTVCFSLQVHSQVGVVMARLGCPPVLFCCCVCLFVAAPTSVRVRGCAHFCSCCSFWSSVLSFVSLCFGVLLKLFIYNSLFFLMKTCYARLKNLNMK
jgi:hypothetical protein